MGGGGDGGHGKNARPPVYNEFTSWMNSLQYPVILLLHPGHTIVKKIFIRFNVQQQQKVWLIE